MVRQSGKESIPAALLLLGGGLGSRMGGNKLFLSMEGQPLLTRLLDHMQPLFSETILSVGVGEKAKLLDAMPDLASEYGVKIVEDRISGQGPLEGLSRMLDAMACDAGFLYACDMPSPQEAVIRRLWSGTKASSDVSVVRLDGHILALHAFYRKKCLPFIEGSLEQSAGQKQGGPRIVSFYDKIKLQITEESEFAHLPGYRKSFENYNTQKELQSLFGDS